MQGSSASHPSPWRIGSPEHNRFPSVEGVWEQIVSAENEQWRTKEKLHKWVGRKNKTQGAFSCVLIYSASGGKKKPSFYSKCFEEKTNLLTFCLEGIDWYFRSPWLTPNTDLDAFWTASHQVFICMTLLHTVLFFSFQFSCLHPMFPCSANFFLFSFPNSSFLCSIVPWVPLLWIITAKLVVYNPNIALES